MEEKKLREYTTDMYLLVKHTLNTIKSQKTSTKLSDNRSVELLHNIDIELTEQLKELEDMNEFLEDSLSVNIKERMASVTGTIASVIETNRKDPVSKMLRDNFTVLNMIASGYTTLHTIALGEGEDRLADFTQQRLRAVIKLIAKTRMVIPQTVALELDISHIAEAASANIKDAWKQDRVIA
ncbi:MAG: hypothetical protein FH748_08150 [Balneolaceae bacterium]|nr:hypothetical protein [Balneolaceae bacterium]